MSCSRSSIRARRRVPRRSRRKAAYDELSQDLGATSEDLDATEKELEDAQKKADTADQDAAAAEREADQAKSEADKAKAETDKAEAEAEAADSKATIAADCAKATSALGAPVRGRQRERSGGSRRTGAREHLRDLQGVLGRRIRVRS